MGCGASSKKELYDPDKPKKLLPDNTPSGKLDEQVGMRKVEMFSDS